MINNEPVKMGDYLYDLLNGRGKVVATDTTHLELLFDNGRRMTYDRSGYLNGVRRLFWQYPLLIDPPKNAEQWEHIKTLMRAVDVFTTKVAR